MSDDLINRLRDIQGQAGLFASAAADRIEELEADLRHAKVGEVFWRDGWNALDQDKRAVEAKLEKAMAELNFAYYTLGEINPSNYDHDDVCNLNDKSVEVIISIKATLAELTGGKDE